jgi:hypothetical protein
MSGSKSDYLEAALLNLVLGGTAWSAPATTYIALSTAAYSDAATGGAMTEVSTTGTGYARVALTNNATNWPSATGTSPTTKNNGTVITFPTATGSWGTVTSFYIVDAASAGNVLYGGDLGTAKTIASGDTASFATSPVGITITED